MRFKAKYVNGKEDQIYANSWEEAINKTQKEETKLQSLTKDYIKESEILKLSKDCSECSHRQQINNVNRCTRRNNSICELIYKFCKGKHYLNVNDGLSIYAFHEWIRQLNSDERELPLMIEYQNTQLKPTLMLKKSDSTAPYWKWTLYCTEKQENIQEENIEFIK